MGQVTGESPTKTEDQVGKLDISPAGNWLWEKGLHHLYYPGGTNGRLKFLRLSSGQGFFNLGTVYLPGGIAGTVISHNSWNNQEMMRELSEGVTITAGAGRAYGGAPHIHNRSWWDDDILYPFLLKGKTIGEILLMNQIHLGWITTFIGDPLYHLPQDVETDQIEPYFNPNLDIHYSVQNVEGKNPALWVRLNLHNTSASPETAQLRITTPDGNESLCHTFDSSPIVMIDDAKEICNQLVKVEVMNPYGNKNVVDVVAICNEDAERNS
jgi:hypothetical protein